MLLASVDAVLHLLIVRLSARNGGNKRGMSAGW